MGLFARNVHNIKGNTSRIGNRNRTVRRFTFQLWRAGIRVAFGAGNAHIHVFLLQFCNQIAVFSVDHWQRAQLGAAFERGVHLIVLDHQRALVGHEVFERVNTHFDGIRHLVKDVFVPTGNRHVVTDIRANLRCRFAMPLVNSVLDRAIGAGQTEVHQHGRTTTSRRPSAGLKRLGRGRAHERHFQMRMRINPAGDHIGSLGINVFVALQIFADLLNLAVLNQNIRFPRAIRRDDRAAFDYFGHINPPVNISTVPI